MTDPKPLTTEQKNEADQMRKTVERSTKLGQAKEDGNFRVSGKCSSPERSHLDQAHLHDPKPN